MMLVSCSRYWYYYYCSYRYICLYCAYKLIACPKTVFFVSDLLGPQVSWLNMTFLYRYVFLLRMYLIALLWWPFDVIGNYDRRSSLIDQNITDKCEGLRYVLAWFERSSLFSCVRQSVAGFVRGLEFSRGPLQLLGSVLSSSLAQFSFRVCSRKVRYLWCFSISELFFGC